MSIAVEDLMALEHLTIVNRDRLRRRSFPRVSTDTRTLRNGDLFIALRGETTDGHRYLADAIGKGAACVLVEEAIERGTLRNTPAMIVRDTMKAMGDLARRHRMRFTIPVIAVAGSNGKTTTKEMVGAVLRRSYAVHQTMGNLNNHIGVPLTIFGLQERHDVAVVEVGTNHFGELRYLCGMLKPTHALVTNIGGEHLEFFRSLDGVAREEGEVYRAIKGSGTAFVNADDERVRAIASPVRRKVLYGFTRRARIRGEITSYGTDGCALCSVKAGDRRPFVVQSSLPGKQSALNALAATAVGLTLRVPVREIQRALRTMKAPGKRMETLRVRGVTVLNDAYNANADSVIAALETLKAIPAAGRKIVILGDMLELGESSIAEHARVGKAVGSLGFGVLLTVGPAAETITASARGVEINMHFDQKNLLAQYAAELAGPGDVVLVKGSRGMRMEDIVFFLQERAGKKPS